MVIRLFFNHRHPPSMTSTTTLKNINKHYTTGFLRSFAASFHLYDFKK